MISHHAALIYTMVLVSASDRNMTDAELETMGETIGHLPIFKDYDRRLLPKTASACAELLDDENGLERALDLIKSALPEKLRETAYALACDVVASDREASQEELRMLELIRDALGIDRLAAAAIERGARAHYRRL
ncbi:MAG TPA: tellurite resistance TerB family protein [Alphaproteobacteria bacterium]|nr:tellurite resistance TerB family protein [Alphaproteobacteria bacterium]